MIEVNQDEQSSETLTRLMRQLADTRRAAHANAQALEDERAAGRNAFVVAAAAHAYCEAYANWAEEPSGETIIAHNGARAALLAAHQATTPSEHQTHVVVAVDELERLQAIKQRLDTAISESAWFRFTEYGKSDLVYFRDGTS